MHALAFTGGAADPVREEMLPYLECEFGNPSSAHAYGRGPAPAVALGAIRFTLGRYAAEVEIDHVSALIAGKVIEMRGQQ